MQAAKANYERESAAKEEQAEDYRRKFTLQIRDLEAKVEEEKKGKFSALAARKKMESELAELEAQLESESKNNQDIVRQYKKVQAQLKDALLGADEARQSQEDFATRVKELTKKVKTLEGDLTHSQEVSNVYCVGM